MRPHAEASLCLRMEACGLPYAQVHVCASMYVRACVCVVRVFVRASSSASAYVGPFLNAHREHRMRVRNVMCGTA